MATHIETTLVDDLDGNEAAETVRFALEGTDYEIDLSKDNAEALRGSLAGYLSKARRAGGRKRPGASAPRRNTKSKQIREWAKTQGMTVSNRGRVNTGIVEAYEKAHSN